MRLPFASIALGAAIALAAPLASLRAETPAAITAAVAAPTRTAANKQRDIYRHPAETLAFFGITPGQTVVEYSPGGGWYTEILAPLFRDKGLLYAAQAPGKSYDALTAKFAADPATYGKVKLVAWPAEGLIPDGSVDTLLTFRNIHNMVMNGTGEASFKRFFAMLKPGGVLGIEDHRLPEGRDSALEKTSGYLKRSTIISLARQAGFVLEAESEINANPRDSADWPNGVWTLPPTYQLGDVDRAKYAAIGESDRMTLRFRKPKR
ncbi:MAG TPA: methyltransferase [Sphingobium sp.]|uniref:class I SAM-dependent methyltransferase n=1 Tax=Sphingobium sp. TaxID=1912891 RepID=UPI002ED398AB